jgi:hypothetical protein
LGLDTSTAWLYGACMIPKQAKVHHSIPLRDESDDGKTVSVVAVKPSGLRDAWRVLRGTYRPMVTRKSTITYAKIERTLKEVWTDDKLIEQLRGPILQNFLGEDR